MAITKSYDRTKLNGVVTNSVDLITKTTVEGASYWDIPICLDNYVSTPVSLTGLSWSNGGNTITGSAPQLANVKIGSVIETAGGTSDFASGTYVTAKPSSTTFTVSTNALQAGVATTATATLTVDATVAILRITPNTDTQNLLKCLLSVSVFNGSTATDSNGNGYDEVVYSGGTAQNIGSFQVNLDTFSTNFGKARTNS